MKNISFFDRLNNWIANSISVKLVSIGILILIMLIPMSRIQSLISEREWRREEVQQEVSDKWGNEQQLTGPVLTVPYREYYSYKNKDGDEETKFRVEIMHFLPENLVVNGQVEPEIRYRGIYEIIVYQSELHINGAFAKPDLTDIGIKDEDVIWKDTFISLGIPDMRGISETVKIKWNGKENLFEPGSGITDILPSGIHTRVALDARTNHYPFNFDLDLNGSGRIGFVPTGKETLVNLTSTWPNPSFEGAFLPEPREINEDGFTASWKVLHLNRNFPQRWKGNNYNFSEFAFGVNLYLPIDQYQRSTRSAKYAILFIALTFLVFFFVEIINKNRIHPFQYILVGLGLCLFYTLLISLSEHIGFNWAYLISSSSIVLMIFFYCFSIFRRRMLSFTMFGLLGILYTFLFVIIQEQDYSLLIGSVALFFILSVVMYISRNVNWYQKSEVNTSELNEA